MGTVYKAEDTTLGRAVALKFPTSDTRERLLAEARTAAALNHPNICTVHEVNEEHSFLAMEYVEGVNLAQKVGGRPLPLREAVEIAIQIAEGLNAAHGRGIVHRDIKPANILVTPAGQVKITDFGLARVLDATRLTRTGEMAGTAAYMAPEQLAGKPADHRSDLYSLGLVLHEMLAGHLPAPGHVELLPAPLDRIVAKAIAPDPRDRYQHAADLLVDLRSVRRSSKPPAGLPVSSAKRSLWGFMAAGVLAIAVGAAMWDRFARQPEPPKWVQLTNLPDSVSQPALSPDGRMLTFIRGPSPFITSGQIYVKMLPDGEPKQLTRDELRKMSPVFSPDGSRIVYTVRDPQARWDSWIVPVLGGEPRLWISNASGLTWIDKGKLLFSEKRNNGAHMKIVTAGESREGAADVYLPAHEMGMAHRSYPAPDGKWALVVEMDADSSCMPCRLVPMDGRSTGRQVGPLGAGCTSAAWTPDGKWMYLSSEAGGTFHIWRQAFPDGQPEQVTSGPTEEEGIAMAPDGRSFITAVGLRQSAVWLHDANGERQISLEGRAFHPKFTPDGKRLSYQVDKPNELWIAELDSGRTEPLLQGFSLTGRYQTHDFSGDGKQMVFAALDQTGKPRLWLASLDRRTPPRQIPNVEGDQPLFGSDGEIFFRHLEGTSGFAYRVRQDGTGLRKAAEPPVYLMQGVSPDGQWLVARFELPREQAVVTTMAVPLAGGPLVRIATYAVSAPVKWSPDGRRIGIFGGGGMAGGGGRTYVLPVAPGRALPDLPPGGFSTAAELAKVPGVVVIPSLDAAPGPTPDVYAFSRETVQRNLYRIPIR